jgi:hypothetical protein
MNSFEYGIHDQNIVCGSVANLILCLRFHSFALRNGQALFQQVIWERGEVMRLCYVIKLITAYKDLIAEFTGLL